MNELSSYRITDEDVAQNGVIAAPDRLTGTAAQNKAVFDRLIRDAVKEKYNAMLTAVEAHLVWEPYDEEKTYAPGNKVVYNGSSYLCTEECTGVPPTVAASWLLVAARGTDGTGAGDMRAEFYDPQGIETDVFAYVDGRTARIEDTYTKTEALSDATRGLLGLPDTAAPDDAFLAVLMAAKESCIVKLQVTVDGSPAIAGVAIEGIRSADGSTPVYTDASGLVVGLADTADTTIKSRDYLDLPGVSMEISTPIGSIVDATLALSVSESGEAEVVTSGDYYFSPYVSDYDVCAVGGGGNGGYAGSLGQAKGYGGGGGGGGFVENVYGIVSSGNQPLEVAIAGYGSGGETSVGDVVTAKGGGKGGGNEGGVGNGNGGNGGSDEGPQGKSGRSGTPGSVSKFDDGVTFFGGGGGGAASATYAAAGIGGSPYGGNGGGYVTESDTQAEDGKGFGGGGGGALYTLSQVIGYGAQGVVFFRWRYAA